MWRKLTTVALVVGLATAGVAVAVPDAEGAARYAAPKGKGAWPCTSKGSPCSFSVATNPANLQDGDHVLLAGGRYSLPSGLTGLKRSVTLRPAPGASQPVIGVTHDDGFRLEAPGIRVQDVGFRSYNGDGTTLEFAAPGIVAERLQIYAWFKTGLDDMSGSGVIVRYGGVLRNSLVYVRSAGGVAVGLGEGGGHVRNVTAIGLAHVSALAVYCEGSEEDVANSTVANSILRGDRADIALDGMWCAGEAGNLSVVHSAYRPNRVTVNGTGFALAKGPGNINLSRVKLGKAPKPVRVGIPPEIVAFTERPGSSSINRGTTAASLLGGIGIGTRDLTGRKRVVGGKVDIGATEFENKKPGLKINAKRQKGKRVRVRARCNEPCTIRVSGAVKTRKSGFLSKNQRFQVRPPIKKKKRRARPTRVKVTAIDLHGNKRVKRIKVR